MSFENKKNIIAKSLRLIRHCPSCQAVYVANRVEILGLKENGILVYFNCPVCSGSLLATITEMPFGVIGSAMLIDLSSREVLKFLDSKEITENDVLEVYQKLEGGIGN